MKLQLQALINIPPCHWDNKPEADRWLMSAAGRTLNLHNPNPCLPRVTMDATDRRKTSSDAQSHIRRADVGTTQPGSMTRSRTISPAS